MSSIFYLISQLQAETVRALQLYHQQASARATHGPAAPDPLGGPLPSICRAITSIAEAGESHVSSPAQPPQPAPRDPPFSALNAVTETSANSSNASPPSKTSLASSTSSESASLSHYGATETLPGSPDSLEYAKSDQSGCSDADDKQDLCSEQGTTENCMSCLTYLCSWLKC